MVVDDYGHHPTEIAAVIAAARAGIDRRVLVVFQPHRYSRTRELMREFGTALGAADEVVLTDIYAAGEAPIRRRDRRGARRRRPRGRRRVRCTSSRTRRRCPRRWRACRGAATSSMTLGAGSIGTVGDRILDALRARPQPPEERTMSVKAPAEKNFRRARVKPAKRKRRRARGSRGVARGPSCCAVLVIYRRLPSGRSRRRRLVAAGAAHHRARQRPALERRGAGAGRRAARHEHPDGAISTAYRRRLLESPWVADVALAPRAAVDGGGLRLGAPADRPVPAGQPALPRRSTAAR